MVDKLNTIDMPSQVGNGIEWPDLDIDLENANQNLIKIYRNKENYKTLILKLNKKWKKGYDKHICHSRHL
jgi:hypothetical protein